jgi:hypothetical protein
MRWYGSVLTVTRTVFRCGFLVFLLAPAATTADDFSTQSGGYSRVWIQQFRSSQVIDNSPKLLALCYGQAGVTKESCCDAIQKAAKNLSVTTPTPTTQCLKKIAVMAHHYPNSNETLPVSTPTYIAWIYPAAVDHLDHGVASRHRFFPPDSHTISGLTKQAFWEGKNADDIQIDTTIPHDSFENTYRIESWLNEKETGMHRQIHHRIFATTNTTTTIFVLIYIPSDLFVNTEDLLEVHPLNNSLTADVHFLLAGPDCVIDQEEPEFVSPPHALLLKITLPASPGEQQIAFSIKIHVRYPQPSIHRFRSVVVPPPILLLVRDEDSEIGHSIHPLPVHGYPQEMWISTGNSQHLYFVAVSSVVASLVGAILMFRDIARVSSWE